MKKAITIFITMAVLMAATTGPVSAMVSGIDSTNYDTYVKSVSAAYGYNKGECEREYLPHEELFYSKDIDHWNVDAVYDPSMIKKLMHSQEYVVCKYINKKHPGWICSVSLKKANICKVKRGCHVYHATVKSNKVKKFKKIK